MINYAFSFYDLEYFLLIFVRVSMFIYIAPFFSMTNTPRNVRVLLSIFISYILYSTLTPSQAVITDSLAELAMIVIKEAVVGLLIGMSANICMSILNFAGHIADMETGLSMAQIFDPATRQSMTLTGGIYNYSFNLMMLASGLYIYLLGALKDTYTLIPVNGAVFNSERLLNSAITFMTDYVLIGFRIMLPIFAAMLMLNAILGVMAKVSPQMNMFAIGVQIKIIVGLGTLFLTVGMLPRISDFIFEEMRKMLVLFVESMI
ncbi:MAG: flagellar biosynthetic protein FliR [Lachnospiraceae bacterium]|nr:flagellar biosynthetic protein FliR [Lachnospiraceae bacterium]